MESATSPLRAYVEAVDSADFPQVVAMFAEESTYIRPKPPNSASASLPDLEFINGRAAFAAFSRSAGRLPSVIKSVVSLPTTRDALWKEPLRSPMFPE
jgi:hypothetical protein